MVDDHARCELVNVPSGTGHPGSPGQRAVKWLLCYDVQDLKTATAAKNS